MPAPRYNTLNGATMVNQAAAVTATANAIVATGAGGTLDPSLMPAGIGADIIGTAAASEAISAGALVNFWNNAGTFSMRNADSSSANGGKKAHGFVLSAVASNAVGNVYRSGQNTGVSGLTAGSEYFLSTAGGLTTSATSTSGTTLQYIGVAASATVIDVQPGPAIGIS